MPNQPKKIKPKGAPKPRPLTAKQLAFCTWYVSGAVNMNATEAASRAGYKGSRHQLQVIGAQNLLKPMVRAEIDKRMAKAMSGADITIEAVLRDLVVIGEKALEAGQYAPATRCAELKGKYLKMFTDRIEHVQDVEDMTLEELQALLLEVTEAGGVDLGAILTGDGPDHGDGDTRPPNTTTH